MKLAKINYKTFGALKLVFRATPLYAALFVFMNFVQALLPTALMALATANFVDTAAGILQGAGARSDIYMPLILLLLVLGAFTASDSVLSLVRARGNIDLQRTFKPEVVKIHASLDFEHIENAESWELISRVSRDPAGSLMNGFGAFMEMLQIIVCISSVLFLIVTQVWWAAALIVAFSAPMFWLSIRAGKKNYQAGRDAEKFNRRTEYLGEVLMGRENIDERALFEYGDEINGRWKSQFEAGRLLQLRVTARMFLITKGSSLILALITILITLTLIGPVTTGAMTAGMFMGIVSAVFGMVNPLGWRLSNSLENISRVGEYMKDLTAFVALGANNEGSALCAPDLQPIEFETLEFRDVRFKYPSGELNVLNGITFKMENGRHYAFVGKNGAGKTTITKLLTGLYTGYEGEILINGKELRQYRAGEIKALFSIIYQDYAKYYISLKDNILLGDVGAMATEVVDVVARDDGARDGGARDGGAWDDRARDGGARDGGARDVDAMEAGAMAAGGGGATAAGSERMLEAASLAGLDETISDLKDGADTPLGKIIEDGQDISGGQWQRVAIARSLISRAPVKILDEPTASLDPVSESAIYSEFEKLMKGKTTVFISHRLGSTKLANEILVIGDGAVAERGTHDSLMKTGGLYAEMFEAQRGWYL